MTNATNEVRKYVVNVAGVRTSFVEAGDPSQPLVVFLHGWLLAHSAYGDATNALARRGFHIIAPDLPGFGGTDGLPDDHVDLESYGLWLAAFLREVGVHNASTIVGHSFGAAVGVHFAALHPKRCASLSLICPVGGGDWTNSRPISQRPLWDWGMWLQADALRPDHAIRVVPRVLADAIPNVLRHPFAMAQTATLARSADVRGPLVEAVRDGVRVGVVVCDGDHVVPREAGECLAVAAGVEARVVSGTHAWPMADPKKFADVIAEELAKLGQMPSNPSPVSAKRTKRPTQLSA